MRICILSRYPPDKGGIATHSYNLAKELASRGHSVTIITYGKLGRSSNKSNKIKIREIPLINKFPLRGLSYSFGCLTTLLKIKGKVDLIHVHPIQAAGAVAVLFKKLYNIPVITTSHGSDLLKWSKYPFFRKLFSKIANSSNKLICVSNYLAKQAEKIGIEEDKIKVVQEGVEVPESIQKMDKVELKKKLGLSLKRKTILFVGSLREIKRPDILLEFAEKFDHGYDFILIGDGPLKGQLEESIKTKKIENVSLLGSKDHQTTLKYIRGADLLLIPSEYEGFGLVAIEASLLETPVVGRPVAALNEVLAPESLSSSLEEKMLNVLKNKRLRDKIIKKNKKIAEEFTLKRMVDEVEKVYREVSQT